MKIDEILKTILELAHSQGFYGRLYENLMTTKKYCPEEWKGIVLNLESQNFKNALDLVLYFEQ